MSKDKTNKWTKGPVRLTVNTVIDTVHNLGYYTFTIDSYIYKSGCDINDRWTCGSIQSLPLEDGAPDYMLDHCKQYIDLAAPDRSIEPLCWAPAPDKEDVKQKLEIEWKKLFPNE